MLQKWALFSAGSCACAPPHEAPASAPSPAAPAQWHHCSTGCAHAPGPVLPGGNPGRPPGCVPRAGAGRGEPPAAPCWLPVPVHGRGSVRGLPRPVLGPTTSSIPTKAAVDESSRTWLAHSVCCITGRHPGAGSRALGIYVYRWFWMEF